jgi:hypothetical protein
MSEFQHPTDLDWLAFQYVTDGLTPAERESFERQLLNCQQSREAVARAVELTLAGSFACRADRRQAEAMPAEAAPKSVETRERDRRHRTWRRISWSAIAASATFLIGWQAAVRFAARDQREAGKGEHVAQDQSSDEAANMPLATKESKVGGDLALAWSQVRRTFTLTELDREFAVFTAAAADVEDAPEPADSSTAADEVEAPAWMLAAVSGMHAGSQDDATASDGAAPGSPETDVPESLNDNRNEG